MINSKSLKKEIFAAYLEKCSEIEIRSYARNHLADFKVPKYISFLKEIPKGATGKLQRIGLAEKLGLE